MRVYLRVYLITGTSSEETGPRAKSLRPGSCVQDLNSNVADQKDLTSYD
jgi:hypothetical protein